MTKLEISHRQFVYFFHTKKEAKNFVSKKGYKTFCVEKFNCIVPENSTIKKKHLWVVGRKSDTKAIVFYGLLRSIRYATEEAIRLFIKTKKQKAP